MAKNEAATLRDLAERCRREGLQIEEVSAGATPPARFSLQQEGFTEFRPGNYVYFDRTQVALGAATLDDCALAVLAMVVSKPAADRIIFDWGSKTLTNDGARGFTPAPGFGVVVGHPNLLIERLSEEHATVRVLDGRRRSSLAIGCGSCRIIRASCRIWSIRRGSLMAMPWSRCRLQRAERLADSGLRPEHRENFLEIIRGARNHVNTDELADAAGRGRTGIGRGLD